MEDLCQLRSHLLEFLSRMPEPKAVNGTISTLDLELVHRAKSLARFLSSIVLLSKERFYDQSFALIRTAYEASYLEFRNASNGPTVQYGLATSQEAEEIAKSDSPWKRHARGRCNSPAGTVCMYRVLDHSGESDFQNIRLLRKTLMPIDLTFTHWVEGRQRKHLWDLGDAPHGTDETEWKIAHNLDFTGVIANSRLTGSVAESDLAKSRSHFNFLSSFVHSKKLGEIWSPNSRYDDGVVEHSTRRLIDLYVVSISGLMLKSVLEITKHREFLDENAKNLMGGFIDYCDVAAAEIAFPFATDHPFDALRDMQLMEAKDTHGLPLATERPYFDYNYIDRVRGMIFPLLEFTARTQWGITGMIGFDRPYKQAPTTHF
jgi:hypothetical protein